MKKTEGLDGFPPYDPDHEARKRKRQAAIEQQAEAFRALKRAWEGPGSESDWLEYCQDFDWNEPQDLPADRPECTAER
jgi:hypothetical protein